MHIDIWAVASGSVVWTGNILESETRKSGVEGYGWMDESEHKCDGLCVTRNVHQKASTITEALNTSRQVGSAI